MAITINGSGTIGGVSVGGLPDGIVDNDTLASGIASSKLSGALPAVDGSSLTGNIGITHITQYYMTSDYYGTSYIPMQNWSQNTTLQRANLGTAVSQSGGVFTFPVTGLWRIELTATLYKAGDSRECIAGIQRTVDNGAGWADLCLAQGHVSQASEGSNVHMSLNSFAMFDVTDTSNYKIRFAATASQAVTWYTAGGGTHYTNAIFTRFGDT